MWLSFVTSAAETSTSHCCCSLMLADRPRITSRVLPSYAGFNGTKWQSQAKWALNSTGEVVEIWEYSNCLLPLWFIEYRSIILYLSALSTLSYLSDLLLLCYPYWREKEILSFPCLRLQPFPIPVIWATSCFPWLTVVVFLSLHAIRNLFWL